MAKKKKVIKPEPKMIINQGDDLLPEKYVDNDPRRPKFEQIEVEPFSEEYLEIQRKNQERILRRRIDNFSNGVNIIENIQKIDIDLIENPPKNWNYLPPPDQSQLISLMSSLSNIGLINPLILTKSEYYDKYIVISGKSRLLALRNLYSMEPLDVYKYPVCFVLDDEKVDQYYKRSLILDLNFSYRTMTQEVFIKMLIERYELLKRSKQYRNESNIISTLADEYLMSKSSICNYLVLRKLSEEVMTLLIEKRIKLQIARLLAKHDHETQKMILQNIDFKDINSFHKMKYITGKSKMTLDEVKERVRTSQNIMPKKTKFTVEIRSDIAGKFTDFLTGFRKDITIELGKKFPVKNVNQILKVDWDKDHMEFFLEKNFVDKKNIDRLFSKVLTEVIKK